MTKRPDLRGFYELEQYLAPLLHKVAFFEKSNLTDHTICEVSGQLKLEVRAEGEVINEQEEDAKLYILLKGRIHGDYIHKPALESRRQSAQGSERKKKHKAKVVVQSQANPIGNHNFYATSDVKNPPLASPVSRQEPSIKDFSLGSNLGPSDLLSERTMHDDADSLHREAGSHFNENALAGQKTPFSITCLTECHFATLSHHDYTRFLARMEAKLLTKTLYFL